MAHETTIANAFLFSRLLGDTGDADADPPISALPDLLTGIYRSVAPEGSVMPYAVLVHQGGTDTNTGDARALAEVVYLIKIVGIDGEQDTATEAAAQRIDALLQDCKVTYDGYQIRVKRQGAIPEFTETAPGPRYYRHQGGYWRISLSPLTEE